MTVELGDRSYPIVIGSGVLDELGQRLKQVLSPRGCAVVTNPTVAKIYLARTLRSLREAGFAPLTIEVPDGEEHKSLASLKLIYDRLATAKIERSSPLIALGGGVIGDLTGFAAATYLRGVPYVQVPTTLLAQVDSSVGGKTGVDLPAGKNLVGAFYQPRLVVADIGTILTLPRREVVAGLVEVIKYGVILDAELFLLLENEIERILDLDLSRLQELVRRCCAIKADVVRRDEREADFRSILNFGHTLGHAVETLTGYKRYLHGEAVAVGMAFAAKLSRVRNLCSVDTERRIVGLLQRTGLDVAVPAGLEVADIAAAVGGDKKVENGRVKFVCVEEIGRARFEMVTSQEIGRLAVQGSAEVE
ncbi:MAG: 3-dehydroquinate synthase [Deltaproteobacteria bacterium]|nr:3-dehydroquinate synthase [Deltaproteobacteria bacterium]